MIYSYVSKTIEQGAWTGVPRFDLMLRRAFPEMKSVTECPKEFGPEDIVITANHLSLDVPAEVRTIVVHHGCAKTHFDRDPEWRTDATREMVRLQREMFSLPNRIWVGPSRWVGMQFCDICPIEISYRWHTIPHWVEPIEALPKSSRPKIIGDWRDHNKGSGIWRELAKRCPQWEFQPLNFRDDTGRRKQYGEASLYLCLSLSEGGSYSVCDAVAAGLPIVMTDVGNCYEFGDAEVIRWQDRDDLQIVADAIKRELAAGRKQPSFYQRYTFNSWKCAWQDVVSRTSQKQEAVA